MQIVHDFGMKKANFSLKANWWHIVVGWYWISSNLFFKKEPSLRKAFMEVRWIRFLRKGSCKIVDGESIRTQWDFESHKCSHEFHWGELEKCNHEFQWGELEKCNHESWWENLRITAMNFDGWVEKVLKFFMKIATLNFGKWEENLKTVTMNILKLKMETCSAELENLPWIDFFFFKMSNFGGRIGKW